MHPRTVGLVPTLLMALCAFAFGPAPGLAETALKPDRPALELMVTDAQTQKPLTARVRLREATGHDHVPGGAVEVPIGPDRCFVLDGTVRLEVPAGRMNIRVERGTEYDPVCETIDIGAEPVLHHKVTLKRWVNMRKLGYLSGEDHLHLPANELAAMVRRGSRFRDFAFLVERAAV